MTTAFRACRVRRAVPNRAAVSGVFLSVLACYLWLYQPGNFEPEPYVRPPLVHPGCVNLPDKEVVFISADADRRLYFAHSNRSIQTEVIRRVATRHGIYLNGQQIEALSKVPFVGLDVNYLPAHLELPPYERRQVRLYGISNDSSHNELAEYIALGRSVTIEKDNRAPYLALKADASLDARTIKQIFRTFQQQGINRFYLLNQASVMN